MTTGFSRRLGFCALAIVMCVSVASPALAQSNDGGIGIGVLAGIVRPKLTADNVGQLFATKTGTMFGFWFGGNRNGLIGFTGEVNYIMRKSDTNGAAAGGVLSFPAIQIPAVFHINFGSGNRNKAMGYVVVGPSFAFNLSQKLDGVSVPDQAAFKGADIGIIGGGGFEIIRFAVEVRGNWGLRTISSEGSINEIKSRAIEFIFKFRFN
jgi:Outer membrane protein beta-barrel domain